MRNSKFIALMLVVSVMLMGAGYAYWSDSVTLTSTVDTGKVNLEYNTALTTVTLNDDNEGVASGVLTYDGTRAANLAIDNVYPGFTADTALEIVNTSTIPVELSDLVFSSDVEDLKFLNVWVTISDDDRTTGQILLPLNRLKDLNFTLTEVLSDVQLQKLAEVSQLAANENVDINIEVELPSDVSGNDDELGNFNFTVTPTFTQFNAQ